MRMLIVGPNFFPEKVGVGKYTGEMAEWLAVKGHEVRVLTAAPHYPDWKCLAGFSSRRFTTERVSLSRGAGGSLTVTRCPAWIPSRPSAWRRILFLVTFALSSGVPLFAQFCRSPELVILVEPTLFCAPVILCFTGLTGARSWLHVQDFEVDAGFQIAGLPRSRWKRLALWIERYLTSRFDRVSTISPKMVERLSTKGVESSRRILFPNWVDTAVIYPLSTVNSLRSELGIPQNAIVALYSGSMGVKHGLELLLDASRRVVVRSDIYFIFCGDGPYRKTLELGKCPNMILLQLQPYSRLNELLNLADIHLLPQLPDASDLVMPSKLTGMMASGRPIVATAQEGTQLYTVLEGRGIVVAPGDSETFSQAIVRLADNKDLRKEMGAKAREYAVRNLNVEEILRRFEFAALQICGESTPNLIEHTDSNLPTA